MSTLKVALSQVILRAAWKEAERRKINKIVFMMVREFIKCLKRMKEQYCIIITIILLPFLCFFFYFHYLLLQLILNIIRRRGKLFTSHTLIVCMPFTIISCLLIFCSLFSVIGIYCRKRNKVSHFFPPPFFIHNVGGGKWAIEREERGKGRRKLVKCYLSWKCISFHTMFTAKLIM